MMDVISENLAVFLLIGIPGLLVVVSGAVYFIRKRGLDQIRQDVYALFVEAERLFTESGAGQEKFNYVVASLLRDRIFAFWLASSRSDTLNGLGLLQLPKYIQVLISKEKLEQIIQFWFDEAKDFLDDGKMNDSNKGGLL